MTPSHASLTFEGLALVNTERALVWHPNGLDEWSVADWALAMAGEAGEVCNAVKKLRRLETGIRQATGPKDPRYAVEDVRKEIGDTLLYLDLLATRIGARLEDCVVETFNRVSEREGFVQTLPGGREKTCPYPGCSYPYLKSPPCTVCFDRET